MILSFTIINSDKFNEKLVGPATYLIIPLYFVQHFTVDKVLVSRLFTILEVSITFATPFLNIRKKNCNTL